MRYSRQEILPQVGVLGQEKISQAKVLLVGVGGLGCPALQYLVAAGVGTIGILDGDIVSESNLHRQILFTSHDIGKLKVEVAKEKMNALNDDCQIISHPYFLEVASVLNVFSEYDIILDGTDNFSTRYLINDACVILNKPFVSASIHQFSGQLSVFNYDNGPTYRCVFPEAPLNIPNCEDAGVLGTVAGIMGVYQANECLKIILNQETLNGQLMIFDFLSMVNHKLKITRSENWNQVSLNSDYNITCEIKEINALELNQMIDKEEVLIVDLRTEKEFLQKNIGGLNLKKENVISDVQILNTTKEIVLCCNAGITSKTLAEELKQKGFIKSIYSLKGGLNAYFSIF